MADKLLIDVEELLKQLTDVKRPPDVFYDFCLKFLDRMLGENTTFCDPQPSWVKNDNGQGWLRRIAQIEREATALMANKGNYAPSVRLQLATRLVQILLLKGKLIDTLYSGYKDCEMKLSLLSMKAQMKLTQHAIYRYVETDGQRVYIERMKHPLHPRPRGSKTDDYTATIDTYDYFLVCLLRHPLFEAETSVMVRGPPQYHGSNSGSSPVVSQLNSMQI